MYVCMYVCIYVSIYLCIYVSMYVCMYVNLGMLLKVGREHQVLQCYFFEIVCHLLPWHCYFFNCLTIIYLLFLSFVWFLQLFEQSVMQLLFWLLKSFFCLLCTLKSFFGDHWHYFSVIYILFTVVTLFFVFLCFTHFLQHI